jgi:hypothetical protein
MVLGGWPRCDVPCAVRASDRLPSAASGIEARPRPQLMLLLLPLPPPPPTLAPAGLGSLGSRFCQLIIHDLQVP